MITGNVSRRASLGCIALPDQGYLQVVRIDVATLDKPSDGAKQRSRGPLVIEGSRVGYGEGRSARWCDHVLVGPFGLIVSIRDGDELAARQERIGFPHDG